MSIHGFPSIPQNVNTSLSMKKAALSLFSLILAVCVSFADKDVLELNGGSGPGKGKTIVLVSGDEEYRTEESMPMLAKILSQKHGFDCIVLFAWDSAGKHIDPNNQATTLRED